LYLVEATQMRPFDSDKLLTRNPDVTLQELDSAAILVHEPTDKFFGVNKVGRAIWQILEKPTTPEALYSGLLANFETSRETCEKECRAFLSELLDAGLIESKELTK